jgi:hypothetical protein
MNKSFEVIHRNPGHWDINHKFGDTHSRVARIRGGPYIFTLHADKPPFMESLEFPSVESCMSYVCAVLMKE